MKQPSSVLAVIVAVNVLSSTIRPAQAQTTWNTYWISCATNEECTLIAGSCGEPRGVNIRHSYEARLYFDEVSAHAECLNGVTQFPDGVTAICVNGQCEVAPVKSGTGKSGMSDPSIPEVLG